MDDKKHTDAARRALLEWQRALEAFERAPLDEAAISALELEAKARRFALCLRRLRAEKAEKE